MKKAFKLEDLDCANCAQKMEDAIAKIDGVNKVTVNFMAQKMILEASDEDFDKIVDLAVQKIKEVEPDCRLIR
ncbi:MAG: cation transporter [Clostridiales bacterium]|nr:cation transporter [Clostridiales bacterium]